MEINYKDPALILSTIDAIAIVGIGAYLASSVTSSSQDLNSRMSTIEKRVNESLSKYEKDSVAVNSYIKRMLDPKKIGKINEVLQENEIMKERIEIMDTKMHKMENLIQILVNTLKMNNVEFYTPKPTFPNAPAYVAQPQPAQQQTYVAQPPSQTYVAQYQPPAYTAPPPAKKNPVSVINGEVFIERNDEDDISMFESSF